MPTTAGRKAAELAFLGVFVALIAVALYETRVTLVAKRAASGDAFSNSALFPEIVAGLMALCALAILVQTLRSRDPAVTEADPADPAGTPAGRGGKLALFLLIVIAYIAVFRLAGYYLSTTLAVAALLALLQTRSALAYIVFPAGVALVIGFVFEILFNVVLPLGWFGLTLQPLFG